jgi:hypothetical protein
MIGIKIRVEVSPTSSMSLGAVPCVPLWHGGSQQQYIKLFVLMYIGGNAGWTGWSKM